MNKILKGLAVIVCVLAIFAIFGTVGFAQVNPAEIEIDRIVFSGSSGELTAVPASDTSIQASVTVTNKLTTKKTVLFWAASYTGDALKGVAVDSVELDPGENPVSLSFNIGDGVDKLQAGIWGSAELMAPYINAAVFPSEKSGIEAVYVDGVKYDDFDENTKTYTYFLPVDATKPAYVYATSKNSNKAIEVVQAAKLGESATIKEGTNEYSIKFIAWDTEVGTASDFMKGGILSTEVYAAPSLGIAPPNLTVDANGNALTSDQMFAELQSVPTAFEYAI